MGLRWADSIVARCRHSYSRPPGFSTAAVYIFQTFEQGDPLRGMAMAVLMIGTTTIGLLLLRRLAGDRVA